MSSLTRDIDMQQLHITSYHIITVFMKVYFMRGTIEGFQKFCLVRLGASHFCNDWQDLWDRSAQHIDNEAYCLKQGIQPPDSRTVDVVQRQRDRFGGCEAFHQRVTVWNSGTRSIQSSLWTLLESPWDFQTMSQVPERLEPEASLPLSVRQSLPIWLKRQSWYLRQQQGIH